MNYHTLHSQTEFLLVAKPTDKNCNTIKQVRNYCKEHFGWQLWNNGYIHFEIARFTQFSSREFQTIDLLREIMYYQTPAMLKVNELTATTHGSLLLQGSKTSYYASIGQALKANSSKLMLHGARYFIPDKPLLQIGQRLNEFQLVNAKEYLLKRKLIISHGLNKTLLLKRYSNTSPWQIADEFSILNLPAPVEQKQLFAC